MWISNDLGENETESRHSSQQIGRMFVAKESVRDVSSKIEVISVPSNAPSVRRQCTLITQFVRVGHNTTLRRACGKAMSDWPTDLDGMFSVRIWGSNDGITRKIEVYWRGCMWII